MRRKDDFLPSCGLDALVSLVSYLVPDGLLLGSSSTTFVGFGGGSNEKAKFAKGSVDSSVEARRNAQFSIDAGPSSLGKK